MSLKNQINQDLITAMKARDAVKMAALRMVKSEIGNLEVSGKDNAEATDENVLAIIKRQVKQRKDSIEQYEAGGRADLAEGEKLELAVLEIYMPEMMGEAQVKEVVESVVAGMGEVSPSDMGRVMGAAMGELKGKADGGLVRQVVQAILAG
jgi:uncharacterized protein